MAYAESLEALVLKTYDVGEADRFCILFTREHGRIAAKASGARRPNSKLGGLLLPFRHLELRARESRSAWVVQSAVLKKETPPVTTDLRRFTALQEISELLMRLVPDQGALPDVFDATANFFGSDTSSATACILQLLHHLGLLPGDAELADHFSLAQPERRYVDRCRAGNFKNMESHDADVIDRLKKLLLEPHLSSPLKVAPIAALIN
jgi:recombinational DNA repair protein (RecF pathway)